MALSREGSLSKINILPEENQKSNGRWKKQQQCIVTLTSVLMPRALWRVCPRPETEEDSLVDQPPLDSRSSIWASSLKGTPPRPSLHLQKTGLLPTGAGWEWTEYRASQASSARLKGHKSQKWKTGVRNKTLGFLRTASHFL